jgi:hypothetical protein
MIAQQNEKKELGSEFSEKYNALRNRIDALDSDVVMLTQRLEPVLSQDIPLPRERGEDIPTAEAPISREIQEATNLVSSISTRISEIIDRLRI